jgi:TolB-like protein
VKLLAELKRRNVLRMAGLYLVGAWLVVQVAGTLLPMFGAPDWVARSVVILLAIGFVPALVIAWVFELTPEGLRRESETPDARATTPPNARRMNRLIVVGLLLALGYFGIDKFFLAPARQVVQPATPATPAPAAAGETITDKSIAVLPFADFSASGDQGWFADGLAEEILNSLARTPDLLVSARTSSFRYKGSELAIPQIAKELGVAHVLEGSVRSTPQRIRVTAQLIRARDGFHVWSQTYDRDVADMIEIQEDLAREIALAMQTSMDPAALAAMAQVGTRSVEAYQAYIRGIAGTLTQEPDDYKAAYASFEQARALDPAFAAAHAQAAAFWLEQLDPTKILSGLTSDAPEQIARQFSERIDLAIEHAASATDRLGYRAKKAFRELRLREAIELTRALLVERPGDSDSINRLLAMATAVSDRALAQQLLDQIWPQALLRQEFALTHLNYAHRSMDKARAADLALELYRRWPDQPAILYQIHRALLWDRRVEQAAEVLASWKSLTGADGLWNAIPPARQACAEGRRAEVEAALAALPVDDLSQRWHLLMLLGRTEEAVGLLRPLESAGNTFALAGFLAYPHFDPTPFPSLMQVLQREKVERPAALPPPFACPPATAPS